MGGSGDRVRIWKLRRCLWSAERQEKPPGAQQVGQAQGTAPFPMIFFFFLRVILQEKVSFPVHAFFFSQPSWLVAGPAFLQLRAEEQQKARRGRSLRMSLA